jgi:hypothetical protein
VTVKDAETATFLSLEVWTLAIGMLLNVVGVMLSRKQTLVCFLES